MGTKGEAESEYEQASPPPYMETEQSDSASIPQPNYLYPPLPYHKLASSRAFQVDFTSVTQRHLRVTDAESGGNVIYSADLHVRKPNMVFKSDPANDNLATVELPTLGKKIKIRLRGEDITLPLKMFLTSYYNVETTFESQALQNTRLTWKRTGLFMQFDFECRNEQSTLLAKFISSTSWSWKKAGRLEFYGTRASNGQAMDELLVTGLAAVYYAYMAESPLVVSTV